MEKGNKLSPWCKAAKKALIDRDMTVTDLARALGMTREYTSSVLNGSRPVGKAVRKISDYLNIPNKTY